MACTRHLRGSGRASQIPFYGRGNYIPVFHGTPNQYGYGLGNLLGSLFRMAVPFIKKGARFVAPSITRMAKNVTRDVILGENVGTSIKRRGRETAGRIGGKIFRRANRRFRGRGLRPSGAAVQNYGSHKTVSTSGSKPRRSRRLKKKKKRTSYTYVRSKIAVTKQKGRGLKRKTKKKKKKRKVAKRFSSKRRDIFSRYNF